MYLRYWLFTHVVLLIAAFWWCTEIFGRLGSDVDAVRHSKDYVMKGVIVFFWLLTIAIVYWIAHVLWGLVGNVVEFFG